MAFITICTNNKYPYFGISENDEVILSEIGKIVRKCLDDIPLHFPNTKIDCYIIMPNPVHAIIIIEEVNNVETPHGASKSRLADSKNKSPLSVIVSQYKASVTRTCRKKLEPDFTWQSRFYEHVIRNTKSLEKTRNYITLNPYKWNKDEYYL